MNWKQEFEYYICLRLRQTHKILSVTRLGTSLLQSARLEIDSRLESGASAKRSAEEAIDAVVYRAIADGTLTRPTSVLHPSSLDDRLDSIP